MADARHDQAVSLLTGLDRSIRMEVYREHILPKGELPDKLPPGSHKIPRITQPVINWQQSSGAPRTPSPNTTSAPTAPGEMTVTLPSSSLNFDPPPVESPSARSSSHHSTPRYSAEIETNPPEPPITAPATLSPFSSAVPTSYSYLSQSPDPVTPPHTVQSPPTKNGKSPLSSADWSAPATTVQPPKFVYPGFHKSSASSSPSATTTTTMSTSTASVTAAPTVTSSVNTTPALPFPPATLTMTSPDSLSPAKLVSPPVKEDRLSPVKLSDSVDSNHVDAVVNSVEAPLYPVEVSPGRCV